FQAEDGIRDKLVTGVQTCALPIFLLDVVLLDVVLLRVLFDLVLFCLGFVLALLLAVGADAQRNQGSSEQQGSKPTPRIHLVLPQIGRASCRERVEISVRVE